MELKKMMEKPKEKIMSFSFFVNDSRLSIFNSLGKYPLIYLVKIIKNKKTPTPIALKKLFIRKLTDFLN
jgi:hypothetical protein